VGLTADIEKAFLMVSIKEDRNMLRFLWFDNPEQETQNSAISIQSAFVWIMAIAFDTWSNNSSSLVLVQTK